MKNIYTYLIVLSVTVMAFAGCDSYVQDDFVQQYVVESYLIAEDTLPPVFLTRTNDFLLAYDASQLAVAGANVVINKLDANGAVTDSWPYSEDSAGVYNAVDKVYLIEPLTNYQLNITFDDNSDVISAQTVVPDTFNITDQSNSVVEYLGTEQFERHMTTSAYPLRNQSVYIFTVHALTPDSTLLTPFYSDVTGRNDDFNLEELVRIESGIINEETLEHNDDGTLTAKLPWIGVAFFGPTEITLSALDNNMYDFWRTQSVQTGGSILSPGEIPNVFEYIEGGTGIFGSLSQAKSMTLITPPSGGPN